MSAAEGSLARWSTGKAYRAGVFLAGVTAFLTVWTTIVRDDGNAAGSFMVVLAAAVGAFAAGLQAQGMARALVGVAVMNAAMGALLATDPSTPSVERAVLWTVVLSGLWLASAALFRRAAQAAGATARRS